MAALEFLGELSRVIASTTDLQPILEWIVRRITTMLAADEGSIRLLESEGHDVLKTRYRAEQPGMSLGSWPISVSRTVMGYLVHSGQPLTSLDLTHDPRFPGLVQESTRIRSVLAVSLTVEGRFTGILAVTKQTPGHVWKHDEIELLSIVAANFAGAIEQARLRQIERKNRQIEEELHRARDNYMDMMPQEPLRFGAWELCGRVVPAGEIGGDAFDFFPLGDGRFGLAIADVAGKGVDAAQLTFRLLAYLRAFCHGHSPICEAIGRINRSVARTSLVGRFITLFYGEFDSIGGVLRYCNAGHNFPLVRRRDGSLIELSAGGLVLGVMENWAYDEGEIPMEAGDSLLLYSDGITDAADAHDREFGEPRLRSLWRERGKSAPAQVIDAVLAEIRAFRGPAPQNDDMTLVVLGARASEGAAGTGAGWPAAFRCR